MDNAPKHLLEFGPFRVDPEQRLLLRDQQPVALPPKAFELLLALLQRSGEVVLKDDLMKLLWPDTFVEESNLGQHVFLIRKALGEKAQGSSYIVTVPGRGYRFAHRVTALPSEEEEIVVESHSRSRVVIEDRVGGRVDHGAELAGFPEQALKALPGRISGWQRGKVAALVLIGAMTSAVAVWFFARPAPMPRVVRTVQLTYSGRVEPFGPAFTDGSRVLFAERLGGTQSLAQVAEQGGEPALVVTSVPSIELYDIDRHHSRMLAASQGTTDTPYPLWIVPTSTGSARRVGDILARYAAWSPDGQQIAYSAAGDLFIVGDDGLQPHKVFTAPGVIGFLRWSPGGEHLSFTVRSSSTGTTSLWEVAPDGRDGHQLSFAGKDSFKGWGAGECCGDWSPDGRYFLFRSSRDGVASLWIVPRQKRWLQRGVNHPVQLYTTPDRINEPRFSTDGRKILFVDYQEKRELVRYDSARKLFVPYLGGIPARHISFSRDGLWVAYKNQLDGCLWRSRVDGTQALQLTFPPLDVYHSTWSPDGKTIAFEGSGRLYTIPFDGGTPERLLPEEAAGGQPSWSADGKTLVFTSWSSPHDPIALLDLTTRQVQVLPASEYFEGPRWSPDGKYIAAGSIKDKKLMLFDLESRLWSELADGAPYGWGIRWSSDSKYVYYQHVFREEQPIFRVRVSDRKVEQITSSREILRADVLSYSMTGLTPDNSPLASFVHTNSDVYALELELP